MQRSSENLLGGARRGRPGAERRDEAGWVLLAALMLSTAVASLTVTWARHAVLAKKALQVNTGASDVEESARSAIARVRERMRRGDPPGCTCHGGIPDEIDTPSGHHVKTEREEGEEHDKRHLKVNSKKEHHDGEHHDEDEASTHARVQVEPESGSDGPRRTQLRCEMGDAVLAAGLLTSITGDVTFDGTEIAGLFVLEQGCHLILDDVVLRGTILTRAGLCKDQVPLAGMDRPQLTVRGDTRLLAGTELPEIAVVGPDCRFRSDEQSRVEIEGFVVADELELEGRGTTRGMLVSGKKRKIGTKIKRPGHGRGPESWPVIIDCGAERIVRVAFPVDDIDEPTLDTMESYHPDDD